MSTVIETVFENGVFRPLTPVSIPEHKLVIISFEDHDSQHERMITDTQRRVPIADPIPPLDYPLSELGEQISTQPIPLEECGTARIRFVDEGELTPPPYPED